MWPFHEHENLHFENGDDIHTSSRNYDFDFDFDLDFDLLKISRTIACFICEEKSGSVGKSDHFRTHIS